ncbi:hypothetical protein ACGFR6_04805 [Streptomyces sp. NPDC048567]|uniref:hypothetical protein n=1 Tax=Streptomyces sp. NPDC048567 TaxID=3365570 RepID=UPI003722E884
MKAAAHPGWDRLRYEEIRQARAPADVEPDGFSHLQELCRGGHMVAASGDGRPPGTHPIRDAALLAYGPGPKCLVADMTFVPAKTLASDYS